MGAIEKLLEKATDNIKEELATMADLCEEKLGIDRKDVFERFQKEYAYIKTKLPTLDEEGWANRAWVRTKAVYKRDLRSPAQTFEGIIFAVSGVFDMAARARLDAKEVWRTNPDKAVAEGWTDTEGNPLDRRETFASGAPNRNFGKPLPEHANIQNIAGLAAPKGEEPMLFRMALGDNLAGLVEIPTLTFVKFRANIPDRQDDPTIRRLNPYAHITFEPTTAPDDFDAEEILHDESLEKFWCSPLAEIPEYHEKVANDPQRMVIVEGDVEYISPEPNPVTGNRLITISDDSLASDQVMTCWIPPHLFRQLDFGSGSRVILTGSTVKTEREGIGEDWLLNVQGIYALPRFKIPPDEVPQSVVSRSAQQVR